MVLVTANYWAFTLIDGAQLMLLLLFFANAGYALHTLRCHACFMQPLACLPKLNDMPAPQTETIATE